MPRGRTYRIAVAQIPVDAEDQRINACRILEAMDAASGEGADFLLTPEGCLTGYHGRFDKPLRDELLGQLRGACRRSGLTAIIGACDKRSGKTFIEQVVIGGDGRILGRHAKMVLAGGDRKWAAPGRRLGLFRDRGLAFGCLICNDLWVTPGCGAAADPRLTLRLARRGARVIFHSIHSGSDGRYVAFHESNLALRAMEGELLIATANAAVAARSVNASTGIMGPDGEWIIRCRRRGRQLAVADVTIDKH